jgi:hypothetical protein
MSRACGFEIEDGDLEWRPSPVHLCGFIILLDGLGASYSRTTGLGPTGSLWVLASPKYTRAYEPVWECIHHASKY